MVQEIMTQALQSQGFTVAAFLVAIIALWRSLHDANKSRITALETAVSECMRKHDDCEKRNRILSAALIDVIENREAAAVARCKALLQE